MNISRIRDLDIAKSPFNFSKEITDELNYEQWKFYIATHSDYFIWIEDTQQGKKTVSNINSMPDWVKERIMIGYQKRTCCADYCAKNNHYNIDVSFHKELRRIRVSFERQVALSDLKRFLDMANYLDALLLYNGTEIIDEKLIKSLE